VQFPVTAVLFVAYFVSVMCARSPGGTLAMVGSFAPPTAPLVMIVRLAYGEVAWWQIGVSVASVVLTVYAMVRLAGRLYAGAVLRFGGRVGLKEAWRGAEV
jgi:ABC-2 type transport system permease protein